MTKFISFSSLVHMKMLPNVAQRSMRFTIVLLVIFLTTIAHGHTIHRRQNIFESAASIDKANLSVSDETVAAMSSENGPPAIFDENDGVGIEETIKQPDERVGAEVQSREVNHVNNNNHNHNNNELVKTSSTTDINNVIEQSFGVRTNVTNARAAIVTIATPAADARTSISSSSSRSSSSSTSNAPINFTKDFSHDESVENR